MLDDSGTPGDPGDDRPFSEFIERLPLEARLNGADSGYIYTVNTDGSVYKLMARKTVESEVVGYDNEFKSCDVTSQASNVPICNYLWSGARNYNDDYFVSEIPHCRNNNQIFRTSYGVWGGFAEPNDPPDNPYYERESERLTENVICRIN